jgi:CheY-like chemotaxis protein
VTEAIASKGNPDATISGLLSEVHLSKIARKSACVNVQPKPSPVPGIAEASGPGGDTPTQFGVSQFAPSSNSASPVAPNQFQRGHGELVLLVDDDSTVRFIATKILTTYGYSVLAAENGAEGIALYILRRSEVAVVISDLMMPVMDGPTMIRRLVEINPQVKIVVASGSLSSEGMNFPQRGVHLYLEKPYTATALLQVVHDALVGNTQSVA